MTLRIFRLMGLRQLVVFCCICVFASLAIAQEQSAKPTKLEQLDKSLREFFSAFLGKKAAVGGTVMRGESLGQAVKLDGKHLPLLLKDKLNFKVLPGSRTVRLSWDSKPEQRWILNLEQSSHRVQGGLIEVPLSIEFSTSLYGWELRPEDQAGTVLSGHWFFLQGTEARDTKEMNDLLGKVRAVDSTQSNAYQQVCRWMHQEQLINFNQWCID